MKKEEEDEESSAVPSPSVRKTGAVGTPTKKAGKTKDSTKSPASPSLKKKEKTLKKEREEEAGASPRCE